MDIAFTGPCTVDKAGTIHQSLLDALGRKERTTLSFKDVTEADLSFFQLVHSAVRTFAEEGLELALLADLPADLGHKAVLAGLGQIVSGSK